MPSFFKISAISLLASALCSCGALDRIENIGSAPKLSPLGNPADSKLVAEIPKLPPITHDDNSLWQPNAKSFFSDPRASRVGDVITVNVTVADSAAMQDSTSNSRTNSDTASMGNFFGLENIMTHNGLTPGNLVNMGSANSNVGSGSINRQESINMTMAALVAQVLPNGNLVIQGHQQVRVNNEMRDMQVSGIVRREDITQENTVNLSQIAEARISYGGQGTVSNMQQPRYGSQLFDILMPW